MASAPAPAPTATPTPTPTPEPTSEPQISINEASTNNTPELKQQTLTTETEQTDTLGIASTSITNENDESINDSNRYLEETSLIQEIQQESYNSLARWAESSGLINTRTDGVNESEEVQNTNTTTTPGEGTEEETRALAFVSDALSEKPGRNSGLLETLVLGGGLLYALDRINGNRGSNLLKQLFPAKPGFFLVGGIYERVITVFRAEDSRGFDRVIAAKITDEHVEILAEQLYPWILRQRQQKATSTSNMSWKH